MGLNELAGFGPGQGKILLADKGRVDDQGYCLDFVILRAVLCGSVGWQQTLPKFFDLAWRSKMYRSGK